MTDERKPPETIAEWEEAGRRRFHDEKEPYPTRESHSAEAEAAYARGYRLEAVEWPIKKAFLDDSGED